MHGMLSEHLIAAKIEQKCDIKKDPTYDHVYKLDFIVDRFKSIAKLIPIGVQVTTKSNDVLKMKRFFEVRKKKMLVDKSIYVEVHSDVDIDNWGSELIYNALVSFAFQKKLKETHILGVRINPDVTYDFFDIEEAIQNYLPESGICSGKIVHYKPNQGWGFIKRDNQQWFFHIHDVDDEKLKNEVLPHLASGDSVSAVYFRDMGFDPKDSKYRKAVNITCC